MSHSLLDQMSVLTQQEQLFEGLIRQFVSTLNEASNYAQAI